MTHETNRAERGHSPTSIQSSLWDHLSKRLPIGILLLVWVALVATNRVPGTWFTGWDNLHPEFDFVLNLKRAIFGVWQEHQGLGHIGGHGYAATLPHTLVTWALSLVVPINQVRLTFMFLALLAGAFGCYALLIRLLKEKANKYAPWLALIGSLYYLLNYATVQQFYTPLEAFAVHFATLPWLLFLVLRLLHHWTRRGFFLFLLVSLLSTAQGFIPPLFIAYSLTIGLPLAFALLFGRTWEITKRVVLISFATICINAYWILPVAHFTLTAQNVYLNANNNILSTPSWIQTNKTYGTIKNLAILRGFLSQAVDDVNGIRSPIFAPWEEHFKRMPIQIIAYILFGIIGIGMVGFALVKRNKPELAFVIVGILTFSLLATDVPGLSSVSHALEKLPLLRQAFRIGFTKLSILLALHYSIFLAFGTLTLIHLIAMISRKPLVTKIFHSLLILSIGASIILCSVPAFRGNLFYQRAHLTIPTGYQDVFAFFKKQDPAGRIALLPQGNHWGWDVNRWGYSGSGFLWFGLAQPIMERAFDVWSNFNENYYWELSYALYSHDTSLLTKVLTKYGIDWVIFDTSMIPYPDPHAGFATDDIGKLIAETPSLERMETFPINNKQSDIISIYRFQKTEQQQSFIQLAHSVPMDGSTYEWTNLDKAFQLMGAYQAAEKKTLPESPFMYFPFRSLFSARPYKLNPLNIFTEKNALRFQTKIPKTLAKSTLRVPSIDTQPIKTSKTQRSYKPTAQPILALDGKTLSDPVATTSASIYIDRIDDGVLSATFPIAESTFVYDNQISTVTVPEIKRCDANTAMGISQHESIQEDGALIHQLLNRVSSTCFDLSFPSLPQSDAYILSIQSRLVSGSPLTLQVLNGTSRRTDSTLLLPETSNQTTSTFIIPPMRADGIGYTIRLANAAITDNPSINEIGIIKLIAFPWYTFLSSLYFQKGSPTQASFKTQDIIVNHPNPAYYEVRLMTQDVGSMENQTLILSQSFDPGWKAYVVNVKCQISNVKCSRTEEFVEKIQQALPFLFGIEIKNHVLVNNWENAWLVEPKSADQTKYEPSTNSSEKVNTESRRRWNESTTIIIFFLPQLLQWIGFALLPLPFLFVFFKRSP